MYRIYCCTSKKNGYKYIGLTKTDIRTRLQRHYQEAMYGLSRSPFKMELRKGTKFIVEILEDNIETSEEAARLEKEYIKKYNTFVGSPNCKGYNGTRGGEVVPDELNKEDCIFKYDLDGRFIESYNSLSEAARDTGVSRQSLANHLKGDGVTCGGFQWRKIGDDTPLKEVKSGRDNIIRGIDQYTLDGEYIKSYETAQDAADSIGTYSSSIIKVCRGVHKSHKGFIWKYSDGSSDDINYSKRSQRERAIGQYNLDGKLLNIFNSAKDASEFVNRSIGCIRAACDNYNRTAAGYKWKYMQESTVSRDYSNTKHTRAIGQYSLDGQLIQQFESMMEASKVTGVERTSIYRCCTGKTKTGAGYKWKYLDV